MENSLPQHRPFLFGEEHSCPDGTTSENGDVRWGEPDFPFNRENNDMQELAIFLVPTIGTRPLQLRAVLF